MTYTKRERRQQRLNDKLVRKLRRAAIQLHDLANWLDDDTGQLSEPEPIIKNGEE